MVGAKARLERRSLASPPELSLPSSNRPGKPAAVGGLTSSDCTAAQSSPAHPARPARRAVMAPAAPPRARLQQCARTGGVPGPERARRAAPAGTGLSGHLEGSPQKLECGGGSGKWVPGRACGGQVRGAEGSESDPTRTLGRLRASCGTLISVRCGSLRGSRPDRRPAGPPARRPVWSSSGEGAVCRSSMRRTQQRPPAPASRSEWAAVTEAVTITAPRLTAGDNENYATAGAGPPGPRAPLRHPVGPSAESGPTKPGRWRRHSPSRR